MFSAQHSTGWSCHALKIRSAENDIQSKQNGYVSACRIGIPYLCSCSASLYLHPGWISPLCIQVVPGLSWGHCYRGVPNRLADWHIRQLQVGTTCKRDLDGFGSCDILVMQTFSGKHHRRAVRVPKKQVCYPNYAGCRELSPRGTQPKHLMNLLTQLTYQQCTI